MRRLRLGALVLLVALIGLSACGDPEADQRKAFIGFLQTRILDKPGLHVPRLTAEETEAFGRYADHYAVIARFHETMNGSVAPKLTASVAKGAIASLADLMARRADVQTAKAGMNEMSAALGEAVAKADAGRADLKQPDDLKAVYDKTYDRLVTTTAATFRDVAPVADAAFSKALDLADYLDRHKAQVTISGPTVTVKDRTIQNALNAKLEALKSDQTGMQEAQVRFRRLVQGN